MTTPLHKYTDKTIPYITVDCVIFGFDEGKLKVLLIHSAVGDAKGQWKLPGNHIKENETLEEAAIRILKETTGIGNVYLEQFHSFGELDRFPHRRIITVAYFALVKPENYPLATNKWADEVIWAEVDQVPRLSYDHQSILEKASESLSKKIRYEPIGFNLLPEKFTLHQLQELYEALLRIKLDKPNFRRKLMKMKLLVELPEIQTNVSHRAARLYRFDYEVYSKLQKRGFVFEI